jgi:hypothetical protein
MLGFCIQLRVLYQGYWKNRPLQQLFKVFIYTYFAVKCFGPRWPSSGGIHSIFGKLPHSERIRCFVLLVLFIYVLANTAVDYLNVTARHPNWDKITSLS